MVLVVAAIIMQRLAVVALVAVEMVAQILPDKPELTIQVVAAVEREINQLQNLARPRLKAGPLIIFSIDLDHPYATRHPLREGARRVQTKFDFLKPCYINT